MSILSVEFQPDFPKQDISDTNAELLEILLLNQTFIEKSHSLAEKNQELYGTLHTTAKKHEAQFPVGNPDPHTSFLYGMSLYEVTAGFVRPPSENKNHVLTFARTSLGTILRSSHAIDSLVDAMYDMREAQPKLARVIITAAGRAYSLKTAEYALMGAAIERDFELTTPFIDTNQTNDITEEFYRLYEEQGDTLQ